MKGPGKEGALLCTNVQTTHCQRNLKAGLHERLCPIWSGKTVSHDNAQLN